MKNKCDKALRTLEEIIRIHEEHKKLVNDDPSTHNQTLLDCMRYAVIKRFGYSVVVFWEHFENHIKNVESMLMPLPFCEMVIKDSVEVGIITQDEGAACMNMFNAHYQARYAYEQDCIVAVVEEVPHFYHLMCTITNRLELLGKKHENANSIQELNR